MVAVPLAALSGRQQNLLQQTGAQIGAMGGLAVGGGADMAAGAAAGGYIGQQIGRMERQLAMHDPNAQLVFVDASSRAGRRALRRRGRRQARYGGGGSSCDGPASEGEKPKKFAWLKSLFGGKKSEKQATETQTQDAGLSEGKD